MMYDLFSTGVVLMEISEVHKKVHLELEENVSYPADLLSLLLLVK